MTCINSNLKFIVLAIINFKLLLIVFIVCCPIFEKVHHQNCYFNMSPDQPLNNQSLLKLPVAVTDNNFEEMVQKAPVGICRMALDGTILYINEKMCSLLNVVYEEAISTSYLDFYKSETNTGYMYWQELMSSGNLPFYSGWVDLTSKDGDIISCHMSMQHLCDEDGNPTCFLCIFDRFEEEQILQQQVYEKRITHHQNISSAIIKAQEKERSFLAEELHDNINQLLATTKLYIDAAKCAEPDMVKELLQKSSEHVMIVINELRALSKSLTPPAIDQASLIENIVALFQDAQMLSGMCVKIVHDDFDERGLDNEKKLVIYRILQEQYNNILKYADAGNIVVTIKNKLHYIVLIIEDDGVGFNTNDVQSGLGLKNIRNRAMLYNGRVSVQSAPGKGCRLYVELEK